MDGRRAAAVFTFLWCHGLDRAYTKRIGDFIINWYNIVTLLWNSKELRAV
jgi:hypothetical protein